jgi:preprotein translocase subunit SecE
MQPMNRETKRMMQRQGQVDADGEPVVSARRQPPRTAARGATAQAAASRTSPAQFVREVRIELKRVAWPTRAETINYSTVVLITLAVLMALIFALDTAFAKAILFLFKK